MAQQTILLGTVDNDGTGDTAKAGGAKINSNFTELYTLFAGLGTASAADSTDFATAAQGALADTALQPGSVTSNATHTGDVTGATVLTIANDAVTGEKLRNSVGYSVMGRDLSTTGSPVDIVCTPNNGVLGRVGGNLRFDLIQTANLQDDTITLAKLENFAQYTVLGSALFERKQTLALSESYTVIAAISPTTTTAITTITTNDRSGYD